MRDETEEAILHVIGKRNGARLSELLLELNEVYPKREIRRHVRILMEQLVIEMDNAGELRKLGES